MVLLTIHRTSSIFTATPSSLSSMAPFSNFISFLFFTTLLLSLQINARQSQFFSKVTHAENNGQEKELSNKEEPLNKPEKEPLFVPETDNNYGLHGHESGQFPPRTTIDTAAAATITTTTYQPYKTESEEEMNKYTKNKYSYYNKDAYNTNQNDFNNNNYFNKDAYGGNQNELGNTRYTYGVYNSMSNQNNNNNYYNNNAANRWNNGEKQGMSDTRFMEGGNYYYDVESEKYGSTRGFKSKNWENSWVYFGRPNHIPNSYENSNSMEGYQNQEFKFEANKNDFDP